jgi:hypothetical protein
MTTEHNQEILGNACATVCLREGRRKIEGGWTIQINEW